MTTTEKLTLLLDEVLKGNIELDNLEIADCFGYIWSIDKLDYYKLIDNEYTFRIKEQL